MPWANQDLFQEIYDTQGPNEATKWFYEQSKALGHICDDGTSSGVHWQHESDWGPILISINDAKPEKDPLEIAAAAEKLRKEGESNSSQNDLHEECVFCWESPHEAKHLRIRLPLHNESFSLHYSPYAYFPEHCIVATEEHRPMVIDKQTIGDLLELCTLFPDYIFGSNADLPIVGGSILDHHHYQGGRFVFPIEAAPPLQSFSIEGHENISAELLDWPLSTIKLTSSDPNELLEIADAVLAWWKDFDFPAAGVVSRTLDGCQHNTITPIARKNDEIYHLYLILRSNITSSYYPLGVFHPHEEVHRVKKENIGLIEAMGLAILPPRVKEEFAVSEATPDDRQQVGDLFTRGLAQCGVLGSDRMREQALTSFSHFFTAYSGQKEAL